jgi:hypothetical protein
LSKTITGEEVCSLSIALVNVTMDRWACSVRVARWVNRRFNDMNVGSRRLSVDDAVFVMQQYSTAEKRWDLSENWQRFVFASFEVNTFRTNATLSLFSI